MFDFCRKIVIYEILLQSENIWVRKRVAATVVRNAQADSTLFWSVHFLLEPLSAPKRFLSF